MSEKRKSPSFEASEDTLKKQKRATSPSPSPPPRASAYDNLLSKLKECDECPLEDAEKHGPPLHTPPLSLSKWRYLAQGQQAAVYRAKAADGRKVAVRILFLGGKDHFERNLDTVYLPVVPASLGDAAVLTLNSNDAFNDPGEEGALLESLARKSLERFGRSVCPRFYSYHIAEAQPFYRTRETISEPWLLESLMPTAASADLKSFLGKFPPDEKGRVGWMVMEYLEGCCLAELAEDEFGRTLTLEELFKLTVELLQILWTLLACNLAHRDTSGLNNLMITRDGLKLFDFGLSQEFFEDNEQDLADFSDNMWTLAMVGREKPTAVPVSLLQKAEAYFRQPGIYEKWGVDPFVTMSTAHMLHLPKIYGAEGDPRIHFIVDVIMDLSYYPEVGAERVESWLRKAATL